MKRNNRTTCVLALVIALASGCIADTSADDEGVVEQNEISNPLVSGGFEKGLTGWSLDEGRWPTITSAAAHNGSVGARFTSTATTGSCISQRITAKPGWNYTFSGWYRWHSGVPTHDMFIIFNTSTGGYEENEFRYTKSAAWTHASVGADSPSGTVSLDVAFGRCNVPGAAVWDWDNMTVTSCAKPNVACSTNADCCSGSCYNHEGGFSCR